MAQLPTKLTTRQGVDDLQNMSLMVYAVAGDEILIWRHIQQVIKSTVCVCVCGLKDSVCGLKDGVNWLFVFSPNSVNWCRWPTTHMCVCVYSKLSVGTDRRVYVPS